MKDVIGAQLCNSFQFSREGAGGDMFLKKWGRGNYFLNFKMLTPENLNEAKRNVNFSGREKPFLIAYNEKLAIADKISRYYSEAACL